MCTGKFDKNCVDTRTRECTSKLHESDECENTRGREKNISFQLQPSKSKCIVSMSYFYCFSSYFLILFLLSRAEKDPLLIVFLNVSISEEKNSSRTCHFCYPLLSHNSVFFSQMENKDVSTFYIINWGDILRFCFKLQVLAKNRKPD